MKRSRGVEALTVVPADGRQGLRDEGTPSMPMTVWTACLALLSLAQAACGTERDLASLTGSLPKPWGPRSSPGPQVHLSHVLSPKHFLYHWVPAHPHTPTCTHPL